MGEELGGGLGEGGGRGGEEVGGKGRRERERGDDGSRGENQNDPHLCTVPPSCPPSSTANTAAPCCLSSRHRCQCSCIAPAEICM